MHESECEIEANGITGSGDSRSHEPQPAISPRARIYAAFSALMSLLYLACMPLLVIMLIFSWRVALCVIPLGVSAAILAYWFNGLKLRALYGHDVGKMLNKLDWESGRRLNF